MSLEFESEKAPLFLERPGQDPISLTLGGVYSLGRASENTIVVPDPRASRQHARIEAEADGFVLVDLQSQNGTILNGRRISRAPLRPGDEIRIGTAVLRVLARRIDGSAFLPAEEGDARAEVFGDEAGAIDPVAALMALAKKLGQEGQSDQAETVIDAAVRLTGADRGFLLIREKDGLRFAAARNIGAEEVEAPEFEVSWSIAIAAGTRGESLLTLNAQEDPRISRAASVESLGLRSVLAVPIFGPRGLFGAIYLDHRMERAAFGPKDQDLLEAIAAIAALALAARPNASPRGDRESAERQASLDGREASGNASAKVGQLIGDSPKMRELRQLMAKVAATDFSVLITGDSGTGKELVAEGIHALSRRAHKPFVSLPCAAIPESLLEVELFGVAKGAFTGAESARDGLFVQAAGGTVYLDEVSEMSPAMQTRLLRVLQEGEVRPVGAAQPQRLDVRIIASSQADLASLVRRGTFREDLFYRLQVLPVSVPPLAHRREDIPSLVQHLIERHGAGRRLQITPEAMDLLQAHRWPGNVRELENEVRRFLSVGHDRIGRSDLSQVLRDECDLLVGATSSFADLSALVRAIEVREIKKAIGRSSGNKTKAAELLGITRFALQRKMEKYSLQDPVESSEFSPVFPDDP